MSAVLHAATQKSLSWPPPLASGGLPLPLLAGFNTSYLAPGPGSRSYEHQCGHRTRGYISGLWKIKSLGQLAIVGRILAELLVIVGSGT